MPHVRSLFFGLSTLILKYCVNPVRSISVRERSTGLAMFRTDPTNDDANRLQLDDLKIVKVELRRITKI